MNFQKQNVFEIGIKLDYWRDFIKRVKISSKKINPVFSLKSVTSIDLNQYNVKIHLPVVLFIVSIHK